MITPEIRTGMVIASYPYFGFVAEDGRWAGESSHAMFNADNVIDGRKLQYADRVEYEIEETPKGFRTKWVRWIGHGKIEARPTISEEVEGSGIISYVPRCRTKGFIKPDVEGADLVRFDAEAVKYRFVTGDRVSFIARFQGQFWQATEITKQ